MAKKSAIEKNEKRKKMAKKYSAKIARLKATRDDMSLSGEERYKAMVALQKIPNNAYKNRVRNRCALTGRPRGNDNFKRFGICRVFFRELASQGFIPGVTKSSW